MLRSVSFADSGELDEQAVRTSKQATHDRTAIRLPPRQPAAAVVQALPATRKGKAPEVPFGRVGGSTDTRMHCRPLEIRVKFCYNTAKRLKSSIRSRHFALSSINQRVSR